VTGVRSAFVKIVCLGKKISPARRGLWTRPACCRESLFVQDSGNNKTMNIVLIGFRGTGKTIVAALLAEKLGMKLISLDKEIVRRAGMSISSIVDRWGWPKFRELEKEAAKRFSSEDDAVIDAGGGAVLDAQNVSNLRAKGRVFWLRASARTISERIGQGSDRPALTQGKSFLAEVEEILEERLPLYRTAADFEIDTDGVTPEEVADRIVREVEAEKGAVE
jgi:shikimate kinase